MQMPFTAETLPVDSLVIKKAAGVLRAINHKLRSQMLLHIQRQGEMTVTELMVALRLEQSVTSQHLAILRQAGVVTGTRRGKCILYQLDNNYLRHVQQSAKTLITKSL